MSRALFLGVDGGGTKTHFVLVDRDGNLAAWCEGPTSYHLEVGMDGVRDVLTDGVAALLRQAGIDGSAIAPTVTPLRPQAGPSRPSGNAPPRLKSSACCRSVPIALTRGGTWR